MADLTSSNSGYSAGAIDTATTLQDEASGVQGDEIIAQHVNGPNSAVVQMQTVLGSGPSLRGTLSNLVARLAIALGTDGKIKDLSSSTKTTFPGALSEGFTANTSYNADRVIKTNNSGGSATQLTSADERHDSVVSNAAFPSGAIIAFGSTTIPTGWLDCDGSAVSRTTYADLFAAIGTTYGSGNGSTTFNVPDFRGRSILGEGNGASLTNRTLGATGGAESVALVTGELPAHTHNIKEANTTGGSETALANGNVITNAAVTNETLNTTGTGSGSAHENMPPFGVAAYIIKT